MLVEKSASADRVAVVVGLFAGLSLFLAACCPAPSPEWTQPGIYPLVTDRGDGGAPFVVYHDGRHSTRLNWGEIDAAGNLTARGATELNDPKFKNLRGKTHRPDLAAAHVTDGAIGVSLSNFSVLGGGSYARTYWWESSPGEPAKLIRTSWVARPKNSRGTEWPTDIRAWAWDPPPYPDQTTGRILFLSMVGESRGQIARYTVAADTDDGIERFMTPDTDSLEFLFELDLHGILPYVSFRWNHTPSGSVFGGIAAPEPCGAEQRLFVWRSGTVHCLTTLDDARNSGVGTEQGVVGVWDETGLIFFYADSMERRSDGVTQTISLPEPVNDSFAMFFGRCAAQAPEHCVYLGTEINVRPPKLATLWRVDWAQGTVTRATVTAPTAVIEGGAPSTLSPWNIQPPNLWIAPDGSALQLVWTLNRTVKFSGSNDVGICLGGAASRTDVQTSLFTSDRIELKDPLPEELILEDAFEE